MSSDPDDEPFRATQQFRPEERFQPKFDAEPAADVLPDRIEDTGPADIEPDPATLAGAVEEPELLTHGGASSAEGLESTQVHNPFADEEDDHDEPDVAVDAPSQPRRAELPQRLDRQSDVDAAPSGGGLFTPTVPADAVPQSGSRPMPRRAAKEPAELFTPTAPVNGRAVEEPSANPEPRPAPKPAGGPPWPIKPMDGEPPLTLFRGKEMRELPTGTEIDRYGDPDGNLTYTVATPFEQRSLVPDWVERPYHAYRLVRPLEVLSGVAIPWFDQPGGGTAYLLPDSVGDLVEAGFLVEVDDAKPPA